MRSSFLSAIALAVIAMSSCSKSETIGVSDSRLIKVQAYTSITSRATEINSDSLKKQGFKLYGYTSASNVTAEGAMVNISGTHIDGKNTKYTTEWKIDGGPYYWPQTGNVQMFAYAPITEAVTWTHASSDTWPTLQYTVNDLGLQVDLLAANTLNQIETNEAAALQFKHILTQINLTCTGSNTTNYSFKVLEAQLVDIYNTGTFTFNGTTTEGSAPGSWVTASNLATYTYTPTNTDGAMFMPQTTPAEAKLRIKYTIKNSTETITYFDGWKEVNLSGQVWGAGQKIRYNLTLPLEGDQIQIGVGSIEQWTDKGDVDPTPPPTGYAIGDFYPDDTNPIGMVFWLDNTDASYKIYGDKLRSKKGKIVSLDEGTQIIYMREGGLDGLTHIADSNWNLVNDTNDGETATDIEYSNYYDYLNHYETDIFYWVYATKNEHAPGVAGEGSNLPKGWYLPAIDELRQLAAGMSGLNVVSTIKNTGKEILLWSAAMPNYANYSAARDQFNTKLQSNSRPIISSSRYWSVNLASPSNAAAAYIDFSTGAISQELCETLLSVRAIKKFTDQ